MAVCVDASVVLLWLLREDLTELADARLDEWRTSEIDLLAPHLLTAEVPSVLRQAVHRQRISTAEGDEAFASFMDMDIRVRQPDLLITRAWELGRELGAPRLYDMCYVALADIEHCELWTADRRLINLAANRYAPVRWIGET